VVALGAQRAGVAMAMLGAGRLYAPGLRGSEPAATRRGHLFISGAAARDFAPRGSKRLVLAYLGLLWWMMSAGRRPYALSRPADTRRCRAGCAADAAQGTAWAAPPPATHVVSRFFDAALAFVAGLSVLVRPELALVGGLALIMMLVAARTWRRRVLIIVAGGLVPVGYEIFRMGYYGLLYPGTALAKDATGAKWAQGFVYLANFNRPYLLLGARDSLLVGLGPRSLVTRGRPWWIRRAAPPAYGWVARRSKVLPPS